MKRLFKNFFVFLLVLSASLHADSDSKLATVQELLPDFDSLTPIECSVELLIRPNRSHKAHVEPSKHLIADRRNDSEENQSDFDLIGAASSSDDEEIEYGSTPHVMSSNLNGTSLNWSGYVAAKNIINPVSKTVNGVAGIWAVPAIYPSAIPTYSAIWVGIDGFGSNTVEQIGTGQDFINGVPYYYAWFEMYPNSSFSIRNFPVVPGDVIGAAVVFAGNGTFALAIANYTRGVSFTVPFIYTISPRAQRVSAEWIVEAPSTTNGTILPLARFNFVPFANCIAIMNGITSTIASPYWMNVPLVMISPTHAIRAAPSPLVGGQSFFVQWFNY